MTIQERLRKWAPTPGSICDEAAQVIDALTAENERLKEALGLTEAIEGDVGEQIARLRALATCSPEQVYPIDYVWFGIAADTLLSQQREIERLREALGKIAGNPDCEDASCGYIARTALSQHTQSGPKEEVTR